MVPPCPPLAGCRKTTAGPVCGVTARSEAQRSAATLRSLPRLRLASRPPRDVFQQPVRTPKLAGKAYAVVDFPDVSFPIYPGATVSAIIFLAQCLKAPAAERQRRPLSLLV